MRAFAAVLAREVFARRLVFPVAVAAGFMPLVGSLAYGWSKPDAAEGRILVALVAAIAFSFAFAILFGGSVIAGETSEKRISFFFSRPISAAAIWGGKVLAVLVLTFVPAALVLVPAFAASTPQARQSVFRLGGAPGAVSGLFFVTLFLIFGAHAAVTIARLRSPWVALDLILAPALVFLVAAFFGILMKYGIVTLPLRGLEVSPVLPSLAAAVLAALAAASYAQVAVGRVDARRAHGAFSVVLWGILGAATAVLGGYTWWVASAAATDLASVEGGILTAPRGAWTLVGGPLGRGRGVGLFLFDALGSRSIRTRSGIAAFSADGARAAWGEERFGLFERERGSDVRVAVLGSAGPVNTGLECGRWCRVALSPSGRRLAVLDGKTLAAYDVTRPENPQQLAAFRIEGEARTAAFVDEDVIRLFPRFFKPANRKDLASAAFEITELSLSSKKASTTGSFDRERLPYLRLSADGRHLVGTKEKRLTLHDGRTGGLLATLSEDLESPRLRFLTGRRIAVAGVADGKAVLKIFLEGEKAPARSIDLGPAANAVLGGEIAPGRVAVALNPFQRNPSSPESRSAWSLAFVDVATGAVSAGPAGLVPADRFSWWFSPVLPPAEAGSPSASLFLDASGGLVRLDAATGATTVLLGRSK